MKRKLADRFATIIEAGCSDESILADALMCLIETGTHIELIPEICERLPKEQFTDSYWSDKAYNSWHPVFAAVMYCADIRVFRSLKEIGYSMEHIVDLQFYHDTEDFLEIISMNMPQGTDKLRLYTTAISSFVRRRVSGTKYNEILSGNEIYGRCVTDFSLSNHLHVSANTFDIMLSEFIEYGRHQFALLSFPSSILVDLSLFIALNPNLMMSYNSYREWIDDVVLKNISREEKEKLIGATIWRGNRKMYDFLVSIFADELQTLQVHVLFNGESEYTQDFLEDICNKFLRTQEAIGKTVYQSLKTFYWDCCPSCDVLSFLFSKLNGYKFSEPLSAAIVSNEHFSFENLADRLALINEFFPLDFSESDRLGRTALLYAANDVDCVKFIANYAPNTINQHDNEGRNAFHILFREMVFDDVVYCFSVHSTLQTVKQLLLILPAELLYERDIYGKLPYEYLEMDEIKQLAEVK